MSGFWVHFNLLNLVYHRLGRLSMPSSCKIQAGGVNGYLRPSWNAASRITLTALARAGVRSSPIVVKVTKAAMLLSSELAGASIPSCPCQRCTLSISCRSSVFMVSNTPVYRSILGTPPGKSTVDFRVAGVMYLYYVHTQLM